jgi:hypothetical protein
MDTTLTFISEEAAVAYASRQAAYAKARKSNVDLAATLAPHFHGRLDHSDAANHIAELVDRLVDRLRVHPGFAKLNLSCFDLELALGDFRVKETEALTDLIGGAILFDKAMSKAMAEVEAGATDN